MAKTDFTLDPVSNRYGYKIINDGGKQVGYGWSLQVERSAHDAAGTEYYVGDLYDANGSLATRKVFVIEREWDCGP